MYSLADAVGDLSGEYPMLAGELHLQLADCNLRIASNSDALLEELDHYFDAVPRGDAQDAIRLCLIEREAVSLPVAFSDWPREAGKRGRKDSIHDLENGRLIRKVRTGLLFLQSEQTRIAAGPCLANANQIINFINSQYMNVLQRHGWLIGHAAAVASTDQVTAIAGFSGGGKSTLMLKLMDCDELTFVTNDRLFLLRDESGTHARGIPKMPRINPGTIVHNPRLHGLLQSDRRTQLSALSTEELWEMEEKHDVPVQAVYGTGRIRDAGRLARVIILNWARDARQPCAMAPVVLEQRPDLLKALSKSPGPFFQGDNGHFLPRDQHAPASHYLERLQGIEILEVTGKIDFGEIARKIRREIGV